jgi:hypothetical protein
VRAPCNCSIHPFGGATYAHQVIGIANGDTLTILVDRNDWGQVLPFASIERKGRLGAKRSAIKIREYLQAYDRGKAIMLAHQEGRHTMTAIARELFHPQKSKDREYP